MNNFHLNQSEFEFALCFEVRGSKYQQVLIEKRSSNQEISSKQQFQQLSTSTIN